MFLLSCEEVCYCTIVWLVYKFSLQKMIWVVKKISLLDFAFEKG
jgi:hypothetical protein